MIILQRLGKLNPILVSSENHACTHATAAVPFHRDFCASSFFYIGLRWANGPWPVCITILLSVLHEGEWFAVPLHAVSWCLNILRFRWKFLIYNSKFLGGFFGCSFFKCSRMNFFADTFMIPFSSQLTKNGKKEWWFLWIKKVLLFFSEVC